MENTQVDNEEFEQLLEVMKAKKPLVDKEFKKFIDQNFGLFQKLKESKDDKLKLYSAGKQGKFGNCNEPKPGMFDVVGKVKWQAWKDREGQDQEACKLEFIQRAKAILAKEKQ